MADEVRRKSEGETGGEADEAPTFAPPDTPRGARRQGQGRSAQQQKQREHLEKAQPQAGERKRASDESQLAHRPPTAASPRLDDSRLQPHAALLAAPCFLLRPPALLAALLAPPQVLAPSARRFLPQDVAQDPP